MGARRRRSRSPPGRGGGARAVVGRPSPLIRSSAVSDRPLRPCPGAGGAITAGRHNPCVREVTRPPGPASALALRVCRCRCGGSGDRRFLRFADPTHHFWRCDRQAQRAQWSISPRCAVVPRRHSRPVLPAQLVQMALEPGSGTELRCDQHPLRCFLSDRRRRHHTPAGAHSRRSWIAIRRADDIRVRPALLRLHRGIQLNCGSRTTVSVGGRDLQRRFGKAVASGDSPPPPRILSRARPIRWAGTGLRHHLPTWPGSTSGSSLAAKMPVRSHRGQRSGRMGSLPARPSHFGDSAGSVLRAYTVHPALVRAYSIPRQREHPRGSPRLDGPLCGDFSVFERPSLRPR